MQEKEFLYEKIIYHFGTAFRSLRVLFFRSGEQVRERVQVSVPGSKHLLPQRDSLQSPRPERRLHRHVRQGTRLGRNSDSSKGLVLDRRKQVLKAFVQAASEGNGSMDDSHFEGRLFQPCNAHDAGLKDACGMGRR